MTITANPKSYIRVYRAFASTDFVAVLDNSDSAARGHGKTPMQAADDLARQVAQ